MEASFEPIHEAGPRPDAPRAGPRLAFAHFPQNSGGLGVFDLIESMTLVVIIPLLGYGQEHEEQQWQYRGIVPGGTNPRDGLRDSHAKEVEVAQPRKLKEELFWKKVEDIIPRSPDGVGDEGMASPLIDELQRIARVERNSAAVSGRRQGLLAEDKFKDELSIRLLDEMVHSL